MPAWRNNGTDWDKSCGPWCSAGTACKTRTTSSGSGSGRFAGGGGCGGGATLVAGLLWGTGFAGAVNRANWVTGGWVAGAVLGDFATDGFTGAAVLAVDCLTVAAGTGAGIDAGFGTAMPTGGEVGVGVGANVTTRS